MTQDSVRFPIIKALTLYFQAEVKINSIYEAVRDSVPWDVTCVRTKHTVSIHCRSIEGKLVRPTMTNTVNLAQYPYRPIQIVLRLYQSPAEILAGFDVDAPCVAYDGILSFLLTNTLFLAHTDRREPCVGKSQIHHRHDASMQHRGYDEAFTFV